MVTSYSTYIYNHMHNDEDIEPPDIFTGTKFTRHKLIYIHVWGFPVYVLDTTLQQGHKLPKCQPRSHHRIFFGFSPNHSSYVPLILNPATGRISPQLHAILMIPSDQSYIFLSRNNLLLCVMNFLSMVFSTWRLWIKIPRLLYMHNYSLIMNWRRENVGRFVLIICFAVS